MSYPAELDDWAAALSQTLGLDGAPGGPDRASGGMDGVPGGMDGVPGGIEAVLDLARDAAHYVERPAAPLTAFLVGLACGRGMAAAEALGAASGLARRWRAG